MSSEYSGYIYVLSNESMPGIVKIGATTRSAEARAAELYKSNTSVPTPFEVEFSVYSTDVWGDEQLIHETLQGCRVNADREYFKIDVWDAVKVVTAEIVAQYDLGIEHLDHMMDRGDTNYLAHRAGLYPEELFAALPYLEIDAVRKAHEEQQKVAAKRMAEFKKQREQNNEVSAKRNDGRALELVSTDIQHGPTEPEQADSGVSEQFHEQPQSQGVAVNQSDCRGVQSSQTDSD